VSSPAFERQTPAQVVSGFLASFAIFAALVGIVWHPLRLIPAALLVTLVAAAMAGPRQRLTYAAVLICAASLFAGMTVAVIVQHPLW
jgi:hypothetical protein